MRLSRLRKVGASTVVIGLIIVAASACSSSPKTTQNLLLQADAVMGSTGAPSPQDICVVSSQFQPGEDVVFRVKVYDPATGKAMDDKALKSVVVTLNDGQTFNARYGGHPGTNPTDFFWSTAWAIPANYPTGSVPYQVTATSTDGRTGIFSEFNVAPSLLTVVSTQ